MTKRPIRLLQRRSFLLASTLALLPASAFAQGAVEIATGTLDGHHYSLMRMDHGIRWNDAKAYCEDAGGTLVAIGTEAENEALASMLDAAIGSGFACVGFSFGHVNTWIGLSEDQAVEGSWHWVTGEPLTFTNWGPGEPSEAFPGEDFGMMFCPETGKRGQWNDARSLDPEADGSRQFFCEFAEGCQFAPSGQPIEVQRTAGPPNAVEVTWESCGGPGIMILESIDLSFAVLALNGIALGPRELNHNSVLTFPVSLQEGQNTLLVEVRGKPGGSLTISFAEE